MLFLVGSSFIGVAKQYFGDPINCQVWNCGAVGLFLKTIKVMFDSTLLVTRLIVVGRVGANSGSGFSKQFQKKVMSSRFFF